MGQRSAALAIVFLAAALTGCISTSVDERPGEVGSTPVETGPPPLALTGTDCEQGGGQSVHPRSIGPFADLASIVPDPWQVADVLEDTGPQYSYSQYPDPMNPVPSEGDTWGHYHATTECASWTLDGEPRDDLLLGFVGAKVQTPAFADSSADDEYLATVVATDDRTLYERLQRGGVDVMWADGGIAEVADGKRVDMTTSHNGEYLSIYALDEIGPIEDTHVRLWYQHENPDGTYSPIAIDLTQEGGNHYGDQGEGYFHHSETAHHWPLPGAYGHTAAVHYDGFDRDVSWGPRPDVVLETAYEH